MACSVCGGVAVARAGTFGPREFPDPRTPLCRPHYLAWCEEQTRGRTEEERSRTFWCSMGVEG